MEKLMLLIEKRKGNNIKPRYATRKLTIGVVSCMVGYLIFLSPTVVSAADENSSILINQTEFNRELEGKKENLNSQKISGTFEEHKNEFSESNFSEGTNNKEKDSLDEIHDKNINNDAPTYKNEDENKGESQEVDSNLNKTEDFDSDIKNKNDHTDESDSEVDNIDVIQSVSLETDETKNVDNSNKEFLDYIPSDKYSFNDLKFNPNILDRQNEGNTIPFELYGKHSIAASTDNWVINLQIDERLSKYITSIEVEPKRFFEGIEQEKRVYFVRKSDGLGRKTNVFQVNYIRGSSGVFAGAETTDTQTAHNGIIYFEKPINEILSEIGDKKLNSDKLFYKIPYK